LSPSSPAPWLILMHGIAGIDLENASKRMLGESWPTCPRSNVPEVASMRPTHREFLPTPAGHNARQAATGLTRRRRSGSVFCLLRTICDRGEHPTAPEIKETAGQRRATSQSLIVLRSCVRRLNPVGSTRRVCQGTATTGQLAPARPAIPELAGQRLERRRRGVTGTYASASRNGSPLFPQRSGRPLVCGWAGASAEFSELARH
jgi:hypothetical protein